MVSQELLAKTKCPPHLVKAAFDEIDRQSGIGNEEDAKIFAQMREENKAQFEASYKRVLSALQSCKATLGASEHKSYGYRRR